MKTSAIIIAVAHLSLLVLFALAILNLTAGFQVAILAAVIGCYLLLLRPAQGILVLVGFQVLVGMLYWVEGRVMGLNVLEIYGGIATMLFAMLCLVRFRSIERTPLFLVSVLYLSMLVGAAIKAGSLLASIGILVRFGSPILVMFAFSTLIQGGEARTQLVRWLLLTGLVPIAVALYQYQQGQMGMINLSGIDRLRGGFHHTSVQGQVMAVFCALGLLGLATTQERKVRYGLTGFVGLTLMTVYLSHSRTAQIGVAVFAIVFGLILGKRVLVGWMMVALVALLATNSFLQGRFADIGSLVFGDPLQGQYGMDQLGSGRIRIWRVSLEQFGARGIWDWLTGVGLGQHRYLYTEAIADGKASHNDLLALVFQVGVLGFLSYIFIIGRVTLLAWRDYRQSARVSSAFVVALTSMSLVMDGLSNAFISRVNLSWVLFAFYGLVLAIAKERQLDERVGS